MIENLVKSFLRQFSVQIKRYPDKDLKSRLTALRKFQINKIFDVGANAGQFALETREHGFKGKIISFEPLSSAYQKLEKKAKDDKNWITLNSAIGDMDGEIVINIAQNSQSSSILEMLPAHLNSAPESIYIGTEKVIINKLDSILIKYVDPGDQILLKIDTQGYEEKVLKGAEVSLKNITGLKLEMPLIPLYKGELLFWDMVKLLGDKGFILHSLENAYSNPKTGQLLQVDGIFYNSGLS